MRNADIGRERKLAQRKSSMNNQSFYTKRQSSFMVSEIQNQFNEKFIDKFKINETQRRAINAKLSPAIQQNIFRNAMNNPVIAMTSFR